MVVGSLGSKAQSNVPPGGDSTAMPPTEGPTLVAHFHKPSLGLGGNITVDVQQTDSEVATRPAEGNPRLQMISKSRLLKIHPEGVNR